MYLHNHSKLGNTSLSQTNLFDLLVGDPNRYYQNGFWNNDSERVTLHSPSKLISMMVRVFTNGPRPWCSILDQIISKTQKMVLDASLLNTKHYKVWIKSKWSNPGKGIAPSSTPQCSSYWKGSLQVTLDYSRTTNTHQNSRTGALPQDAI